MATSYSGPTVRDTFFVIMDIDLEFTELSPILEYCTLVWSSPLAFFTHPGSCNLLYALFILKQVRHTCCLSLHVYVHCMFIVSHVTVCFCMFLVGYPQTPEPVITLVDWHKLTYLVLTCRRTPINHHIIWTS